ncbi:MAG: tripartite tricarboxylate transporter substrate binding protein, partial [Acetobacteraceae bacterium]|nr:tripartite tricarboxylate transporter substrate binding protein [Acetobacteraceae bacterium]
MAQITRRATLGVPAMLAMPALAQTRFPDKPIKLIIPWAAGGPADIGFRIMADHASRNLGQPVVVENRG